MYLFNILDEEFIPTFLYIKQHNVTGLKYFGKTIQEDVPKYKGSGTYWNDHLAIHGNDVSTIWSMRFYNKDELVEFATNFSIKNNIVEAKDSSGKKIWANLINENGLDGQTTYAHTPETKQKLRDNHPDFSGTNNPMWGKKHKEESNQKRRLSMLAANVKHSKESIEKRVATQKKNYVKENNPWYGGKHKDSTKKLLQEKALARSKKQCEHCGKECQPSNYSRWHGKNCKHK